MPRRTLLLLPLLLCACSQVNYSLEAMNKPLHDLKNAIHPPKPFAPTSVPADFSIAIDQTSLTASGHQHIRQIISSADSVSRITLTSYPGLTESGAARSTQALPLTPEQLQSLWDLVARHGMLNKSFPWDSPLPFTRLYSENSIIIRIQANGKVHTLQALNDFPEPTLPLLPILNAVRPSDFQFTPPAPAPATSPATTTAPASQP